MKTKIILPLKERSLRLPNKNLLELNGKPLFNHILESLSKVPAIDKLCIFSSSKFYEPFLINQEIDLVHVKRSTKLDEDSCSINEVIREFIKIEDADVYVLAHATSPFLSASSIEECINSVTSGEFDSSFLASSINKFAWFRGRSLNYVLGQELKPTSELEPIFVEQGGLYVFTKEVFKKTNSRVGLKPFVKLINFPESIDIDYQMDLDIANKFYN